MLVTDLLTNHRFNALPHLSKNEIYLLEANLFTLFCDHLCDLFHSESKDFFKLMKLTLTMEKKMIDSKLARCVINDILSSGDYTVPGIAYYTQTPEDVVYDIVIGRNDDLSSKLFRKIIKLHQSVRPELYKNILLKITTDNPK